MSRHSLAINESPSRNWSDAVLNMLYQEVFLAPAQETSGVLVGEADPSSGVCHVTALIPAVRAEIGKPALLTQNILSRVNGVLQQSFPEGQVLGWYLSRPSGAYLLPQEVSVHHAYFASEDQIALVIDPRNYQGGVYAMRDGHLSLVFEGPISRPTGAQRRRYRDAAKKAKAPWAAYAVLAVMGLVLGAVLFLAAVVLQVM